MKTKLQPLFTWLKNFWPQLLAALLLIATCLGTSGLIVLAILLVTISTVASIGWFFATIRSKKRNVGEILTRSSNFFFLIAYMVDCLGAVMCGGFLNWLLLKNPNGPYPIGKKGVSVSESLAWNHAIDNLNEWGLNLRHDLNTVDPNHCESAMENSIKEALETLENYADITRNIEKAERTREFLAKY